MPNPLLKYAKSRVAGLNALSEGNRLDELISLRLAQNLDGRYELTAAGAALRAALSEIVTSAATPHDAELALENMYSDLEAIAARKMIPALDSLALEQMTLCTHIDAVAVPTPLGEWLLAEFRTAEASCEPAFLPVLAVEI